MRRDLFVRKDSHVLTLGAACLKLFGADFLEWEPKTVYETLKEQGYGTVPEHVAVKINSFRTAYNTVLPWVDWEVFEKVGHAFLGNSPNFESREPLTVAECMNTINILNRIRIVDYSYDVRAYIVSCAQVEEIEYLPDSLEFCMPLLCKPVYECLDCGNRDTDDLEDGKCDVCTGRYDDGVPNGRPSEGLEDRGGNIVRSIEYDYTKIADNYRKLSVIDSNVLDLGEGYMAIQIAKLLHVKQFCSEQDMMIGELNV